MKLLHHPGVVNLFIFHINHRSEHLALFFDGLDEVVKLALWHPLLYAEVMAAEQIDI